MAGYISKDFIHYGCGLATDPAVAIAAVPHSVRKNIKKAERNGVIIKKVECSPANLDILRSIWYDPADPNIPDANSKLDYMFIAYAGEEPVGVCILLPAGRHLFLNNLAGSDRGKQLSVQDFLLWHCVNYFAGSEFDYIDVGVSYRPALYRFFKKWQTFSYPVIFNKPDINFPININSFTSEHYLSLPDLSQEAKTISLIQKLTGISAFAFVPDIKSAEKIYIKMGIAPRDETFNFPGISPKGISHVCLPRIFSCQFGVLLFNLAIDDQDMWDKYQCLDIFKRQLTYSTINSELSDFERVIETRKYNFDYLGGLFGIDRIEALGYNERISSLFSFIHSEHKRYHDKLDEFEIEHKYSSATGEIGLPIHQNLKKDHLDYIYGVFRGVLNLCSEWEHTEKYDKYKE